MATVLETRRAAQPRPRFTSDQYEELINRGLLADGHYELLDGEIVKKMTKNPPHVTYTMRLFLMLGTALRGQAVVMAQDPLRVAEGWTPEPDVLVLRWRDDDYLNQRPTAADVLLLVEVSDTSLEEDRQQKGPRYALSRVPEYWIVNIVDRVIEVYTAPEGDHYTQLRAYGPGESITPTLLPEVSVAVGDILR